jgi:hypothetical protein
MEEWRIVLALGGFLEPVGTKWRKMEHVRVHTSAILRARSF